MIRICPERDGPCPNGHECPYADTRVSCKEGWRTPMPKATNLDPLQELADLGQALDTEAENAELRAQVEMLSPAPFGDVDTYTHEYIKRMREEISSLRAQVKVRSDALDLVERESNRLWSALYTIANDKAKCVRVADARCIASGALLRAANPAQGDAE